MTTPDDLPSEQQLLDKWADDSGTAFVWRSYGKYTTSSF
jgi:hypothetical protein